MRVSCLALSQKLQAGLFIIRSHHNTTSSFTCWLGKRSPHSRNYAHFSAISKNLKPTRNLPGSPYWPDSGSQSMTLPQCLSSCASPETCTTSRPRRKTSLTASNALLCPGKSPKTKSRQQSARTHRKSPELTASLKQAIFPECGQCLTAVTGSQSTSSWSTTTTW